MSIDRAATLRSAEKLLRQGKLDEAIAEYVRVVEDQPGDWNTANLVGDLYVRAGKVDKAIEQFVASADGLSDAGELQKAFALYKKILKLRPEHEHALLQCAEIAATQGVLVDARTFLRAVADRRRARGDQRAVAQVTIRLASLDADDYPARIAGARARLEVKDAPGAIRDFKEIAAALLDAGRAPEAIEALREAVSLAPEDHDLRHQLLDAFVAAGDHVGAREHARTSEQLQALAARLEEQGHRDEAAALLSEALAIDPSNARLQAKVSDAEPPSERVPASEAVEAAPLSPLEAIAASGREGRTIEMLALVRRVIAHEPQRRDDVTLIGLSLCEQQPDLGFAVVDLAADAAVGQGDWASAAAGLQELVTRVPSYLPALMRLVEVCVDGGLDATLHAAQGQLADAYIEAGAAEEARVVAEDLVAREPWNGANIERFRRALELLGEPDPAALIAARLSGESPFMSTRVSIAAQGVLPLPDAASPAGPMSTAAQPPQAADTPGWEIDNHNFEFSLAHFDSADLPPAASEPVADAAEVDLSGALDALTPPRVSTAPGGSAAAALAAEAPPDLEEVLGQFRDETARRSALAAAEEEYSRGLGLHAIGRIDECIPLLTAASRSPRLRFGAASLLGRIYREQGEPGRAVEWFEQAAQAPPPSSEEGHLLLYDLADVLETTGEYARALAICLELQADAGEYRDTAERVARLTSMQVRG